MRGGMIAKREPCFLASAASAASRSPNEGAALVDDALCMRYIRKRGWGLLSEYVSNYGYFNSNDIPS